MICVIGGLLTAVDIHMLDERGIELDEVFSLRGGLPILWYHRDIAKSNRFCVFCGCDLRGGAASVKEHLIGRNFVPTGSLASGSFNFITRACEECNSKKGDAERHVSSVSLFNSPKRVADERINLLAARKAARDYHPDGGFVERASVKDSISVPFFGGSVSIELVGPPQLSVEKVRLLAAQHVQALFALVTSHDPRAEDGMRFLPRNYIHVLGHYHHADWGNPQLVEVANRGVVWPKRVDVVAADGFFKASLRRSVQDEEGWFWALEWNHYLRVAGAIYHPNQLPPLFSHLPDLDWVELSGGGIRTRREIPITEESDFLFS